MGAEKSGRVCGRIVRIGGLPLSFRLRHSSSSVPPRSQSGQVIVEYVLLMVVAVSISALIVRQLASRSEDDPGVLIKKWREIQTQIGRDLPDQCQGSGCN